MSDARQNRPMGRGLSALMADIGVDAEGAPTASTARTDGMAPIESLQPNADQPRKRFEEDDLSDLAASIRERGIIQPIVVRPNPRGATRYEIVAGERRWRAAQRAALHEVPIIVREMDDQTVLEVAIIENVQRADLNAIEEAQGYQQLIDRFGHTQEQLGRVLGKSRSHLANLMRLLKLPARVQDHVREGRLSAGHARALINAPDAAGLAERVIAKGLSVRETERLAKAGEAASTPRAAPKPAKDADTRALEGDLTAALGQKVTIDHDAATQGGSVSVAYQSLDELDAVCRLLSRGLGQDTSK